MERRYLTVFIIILLACLVIGIISNAVLDIRNRAQIRKTIRATYDAVKANKAEEFVKMTRLTHSMIYKDYDDENAYSGRERNAVNLYATLLESAELAGVSLTKVIERTACLARLTFKNADGEEVIRYMVLVKHQDRAEEKAWVPKKFLTVENLREKYMKLFPDHVSHEEVRKKAQEQVRAVLDNYPQNVENDISAILERLASDQKTQASLIEKIKEVKGLVEVPELAEKITGFEEAIEAALKKIPPLAEKLLYLMDQVESLDAVRIIKQLPEKAGDVLGEKDEEKRDKEKEKFLEKLEALPGMLKSPELLKEARDALTMTRGGVTEKLEEKLQALAEKVESAALAEKVGNLLDVLYGTRTAELKDPEEIVKMLKGEKLTEDLEEIANKLKMPSEAARLQGLGLGEKAWAARNLAADEALNPFSWLDVIHSPKGRYLRLVARLKAIGEAKDPQEQKGEALGLAGKLCPGAFKGMALLWSKLKTPHVRRYAAAAEKLVELAPTQEFRKEAGRLARDAFRSSEAVLPDMAEFAARLKAAMLAGENAKAGQLKALAELSRGGLDDPGAKIVFPNYCELMAELREGDPEELGVEYVELASTLVGLKRTAAGFATESALVANKATREYWSDVLELSREEKKQGIIIALFRLLARKPLADLMEMAQKADSERLQGLSKSLVEASLGELGVTLEEYLEKSPAQREALSAMLNEKVKKTQDILKSIRDNAEETQAFLDQVVKDVSADSFDKGDIYARRVKETHWALSGEKNRRDTVNANVRKNLDRLTRSFLPRWGYMKSREEYMNWTFLGDTRRTSGLSESELNTLVERQEKFAGIVVGRVFMVTNVHHWYPDPEVFSRSDTRRLSVILRIRFQTNPGAEKGDEEYEINDFLVLLEMAPDWSVRWKLHRVCGLYEYERCFEIFRQEMEKREAYFADGKAR